MALTPGVLSKVLVDSTSASLVSTADTGGTTPYVYQWHRSTVSGFTPGTASAISGATSLSLSDTGLSPSTTYYYKVVSSDSDATPLSATTAQLAVATTQAGPSPNDFAQAALLGMIDMRFDYNTLAVQIDASEAGNLVAGQAVKIVDSAGGVPKVVACAANSDEVFGFINYDVKSKKFVAGDRAEVSQEGNVMFLNATGAIARGVKVSLDLSSVGGVRSAAGNTGDRVVGWALDKASAGGVLVRIRLLNPSFETV